MKHSLNFEIDFKRNEFPGKFIVLEGIDGSGKTTQIEKVAEFLRSSGKNVSTTKEPTNSVVGELIRKIVHQEIEVPKESIQYLFSADRVIHVESEIIPKLKEGIWVISDRYFWSSIPYGLADREGSVANGDVLLVAESILSMYHQFVVPDFTFYLDISVETALKRIGGRNHEIELYEKKEKLDKISFGYNWLAEKFPEEIIKIDAEKSVEEVTKEITKNFQL